MIGSKGFEIHGALFVVWVEVDIIITILFIYFMIDRPAEIGINLMNHLLSGHFVSDDSHNQSIIQYTNIIVIIYILKYYTHINRSAAFFVPRPPPPAHHRLRRYHTRAPKRPPRLRSEETCPAAQNRPRLGGRCSCPRTPSLLCCCCCCCCFQ